MGGKTRMDKENNTIMLYTSQNNLVVNALESNGICFSQRKYVEKKYEESAPIFIAAYTWFVTEAVKYLPRPDGSEYPYWVFPDLRCVEQYENSKLLCMRVPIDEAIYFDMIEWNKILALKYLGETPEEEKKFRKLIENYGVKHESDIILTNFYPHLKRQVQESWKRLFRHHEDIKKGNTSNVGSVQAALWCLKRDWIVNPEEI